MTLLLLWLSQLVHADTDAQLWMSTNVRTKVNQDWRFEYTQHLRFTDNISDVQSVMPEFELAISQLNPSDEDWVSIYYERTKEDFEPAHRYHVQLSTEKSSSL